VASVNVVFVTVAAKADGRRTFVGL
jgi:hypothetical protein